MTKLRVGFVSNCPVGGKTGLSRNMKVILPLLYNTNKYELFFLAQGMPDNHQEFLRLPFKVEGAMKDFNQEIFHKDSNYQKYVGYGNAAVANFVKNNKLDVLFHVDDIWSSEMTTYLGSDWYDHIKSNFVQWTTADSEPILSNFKEWAKKCPNMWFWTSFAKRCLDKEDIKLYGHCKVLHGAIDTNDFKPLSPQERQSLRHKFNIADDEKIIIYLGRNQLRKLFWSHMEALAQIRKESPDKKIRLLFHTSWSEGWPLNDIRKELGLKEEDILTTYYCRNCSDWHIQPFQNEGIDCKTCGGQGTKITAGVGSTITESDLNKIYNISDGSCSIFTSGGQEYTNVESLLAGVPLACVNYSCGEDFCSNDFVKEINGTFTREVGSGFKKFVPDIKSIVDYYNYIYSLSEKDRSQISKLGRDWAIQEFSGEKTANFIQEFLDKCNPLDWEAFGNRKKETKNINAQVEDKEDDDEFVVECYKKILNMDLPTGDEGRVHWNKFLKQPRDKSQLKHEMISAMRNAGMEHNAKISPPVTIESFLDKEDKSRVLLVLKESMGDHFLLTALLPEIQAKYPESTIYLGAEPKYWDIYDGCSVKLKFIPWNQELENELAMTGFGNHKGHFNHFHNIGLTTQRSLNYLSSKY